MRRITLARRDARRRSLTFQCPHAGAGPEIDNLLGVFTDRGQEIVTLEDVVQVEPVLDALAKLLGLVVGQTIAIGNDALIPTGQVSKACKQMYATYRPCS